MRSIKNFKYIGLDSKNNQVKGKLRAYTHDDAKEILKQKKIEIKNLTEYKSITTFLTSSAFSKTFKENDLEQYLSQLESLLYSEVNLVTACEIIAGQPNSKKTKEILVDIYNQIKLGYKLSYILEQYPNDFPILLQRMVAIGEKTGNLVEAIATVRHRLIKQNELKKGIISAMTMPFVYMILSFFVTLYMSISIFPDYEENFSGIENFTMPGITAAFISFGNFMLNNGIILLLFIVSIVITSFFFFKKSYKFRVLKDKILLNIPVFNQFIRLREQALIAGTLSILVETKIDFIESLKVTRETVNSRIYKGIMSNIIINVNKGGRISEAVKDEKYIDEVFFKMVKIGEATGNLPKMLTTAATFYDNDSTVKIKILKQLIQPILLIFVYTIILLLFIALLLPSLSITF